MAAKSDGSAVPLQNQTLSRCMPPPEPEPPPVRAPPPPLRRHYSAWDCCWVLCTLLVFFTDGATDLWLAADYYLRRHYWWFALTLLFVALPSAVVQVLSFRWFVYDFSEADAAGGAGGAAAAGFSTKESDPAAPRAPQRSRARSCCRGCVWIFQGFIHLLQLGEVWRYLHALYLGVQSRWRAGPKRRHYYLRALFESADISMLRLLESFLKSAPQLVLQLCFMVHSNTVLPLQALCASASLFSLAWMIASYHKVLRDSRDDKMPMSYKAVVVQMLWHLFAIGARAIAFALFASVFQLYFGIFVVAHWCFMTFWIIQGETDFCMSKWEEIVYNMMVGVVYIFCWFNVKEGRARCRLLCYCMVVLLENTALTTLWYLHRGPHTSDFCALLVLCLVACSQALGTFFMMVYYCLLHPDGQVLGLPWGCVEGGEVELTCPVPGMAGGVPVGPLVAPTDVVASPPRTLTRTTGADLADRDVFQVRPCGPSAAPEPLGPRSEGPVIRIDLPRKQYPAWDAHFIDRRLRKTILILERASPATPRLQYRSLGSPKEVMEYETTV